MKWGIQILVDREILKNKEIEDFKTKMTDRVKTQMINQEMKRE